VTPSPRRSTISSTASEPGPAAADAEADRFRRIFRRVHSGHPSCLRDEWLKQPCRDGAGVPVERPIVWSRRNGAWRQVDVLFVGAAPGNAGGRGSGSRGAHATRIPFGGDVAGANLDVLLDTMGLDRNHTFIVAALNQLPAAGGGEPTLAELVSPVGDYATSVHLLRDTLLAAAPRLVVALGNVAARVTIAAGTAAPSTPPRVPSLPRLQRAGIVRNIRAAWPAAFAPDAEFRRAWAERRPGSPLPSLLLCWHPSAQNMSPFAGEDTLFFQRMRETRDALRAATADRDRERGTRADRSDGVYALADWRELIAPYHERLAALWRERGLC
jgi:uracil-DNA glycosylase